MDKYKSLNFWCLLFSLFSIASIAKSQEIAVEQPKMNLFYTHINNQIFISCENSENLKISIQDNAGVVKPLGNGRYDVLVYNAGIVFLIIEKNGQQIKKKYRVKQFPNPVAHLSNGKKEGYISYSELHVCNFIYSKIEGFDIDASIPITSYRVVIKRKNGEGAAIEVQGSYFSALVLAEIATMKQGDEIHFLNIRAQMPIENTTRDLGSMKFIIR